ncbi:TetR/AcrR family transcriptional regulator [Nocardia sp. NPDC051052]|uniref:TetR/AcrR family transcriptional regulator n=1 Tax=Nocardia sp. NPDC051052 TaxID=3364322 RepID=UPI003797ACDC
MTGSPSPRRRADARRSRRAILDAAARLLAVRPDAGLAAIAADAGVTRQTVYAHFASRDELLAAVTDHVTGKALEAIQAADLDSDSATMALLRMLEVSWRTFEELPALQQVTATAEADRRRHVPVNDHLVRLIRRGQHAGEFDPAATPEWLAAAIVGLGHAAGEEVRAHRMPLPDAERALRTSVLRLVAHGDTTEFGD